MKHVMLFEQFIAESYRLNNLNDSPGADLLRLLHKTLSGGVEFQTINDFRWLGDPPSKELKAAAKKIGGGDDNVVAIYALMTDDWDAVLKTAKKWGGRFIEIEDKDGSAIVFGI